MCLIRKGSCDLADSGRAIRRSGGERDHYWEHLLSGYVSFNEAVVLGFWQCSTVLRMEEYSLAHLPLWICVAFSDWWAQICKTAHAEHMDHCKHTWQNACWILRLVPPIKQFFLSWGGIGRHDCYFHQRLFLWFLLKKFLWRSSLLFVNWRQIAKKTKPN